MKFNLKFTIVFLITLATMPLFAATSSIDVTDSSQLIVLLMPAISWLATEVVKLISKALGTSIAGGWILGLIVPALSALGAYILTLIVPEASFFVALLLGFASTFIDQLIKKMQEN